MIDRLLEQQCIVTFGDLVNAVDTIAAPENAVLQVRVDISVQNSKSTNKQKKLIICKIRIVFMTCFYKIKLQNKS